MPTLKRAARGGPPRSPGRAPAEETVGPARRTSALRSLPQVGDLLERPELQDAAARHGRPLVVALLREGLAEIRRLARDGGLDPGSLDGRISGLASRVEEEALRRTTSTLRAVINATGVVLHTNLGRAPLSEAAARRALDVAGAYTTLEYDLPRGRRGSRSSHLDRLFAHLFPGHAAHVVNNNAAAVLLALNTLADGREVIVSRGELVEIGGSFRIPDVMRKSGAILREVGTTNKTRLADYERAIGEKTGVLLKVHPSNYRIVGFTAEVPLKDIVSLGRRRRVPVVIDQGSGNLLDLKGYGVRNEPSVQDALAAGADLVCFSGDKALGGPQSGILVGRPALVARVRDNSLARALRVDKLTYAALEATLLEFVRGTAPSGVPIVRMVTLGREAIEARAHRVMNAVAGRAGGALDLTIIEGTSMLGGGAAPEEGLPTALLAVGSKSFSARAIQEGLRRATLPVVARIEEGRVLLDLRTVLEEQDSAVTEALLAVAASAKT